MMMSEEVELAGGEGGNLNKRAIALETRELS